MEIELASAKGELSAMAEAKAKAANKITIKVQVGVTMQSGETKPAGNMKLYIAKKPVYAPKADIALANLDVLLGKSNPIIEKLKNADVVATAFTNFQGVAEFDDVPPGKYYLQGLTDLGGGACFRQSIIVRPGSNRYTLTNTDIN